MSRSSTPEDEELVYGKSSLDGITQKVHKKRPRIESPQKLQQILNYNSSVDKVSELLGVDAPTVYEIYKEQAEDQIEKRKQFNKPRNKRDSQKALSLLGHDPSTEKLMQTLGIDEEILHDIYHQNSLQVNRAAPRRIETSLNKKKYAKALATLGFNLSLYKATQVLGVDEDILRQVYEAERAAQDERRERKLAHDRQVLYDKKHNRKALHVIGFDPSLEKALSILGVAQGTYEEAQVGSFLPVENRQRDINPFPQATALVYALSAAILLTSLTHKK